MVAVPHDNYYSLAHDRMNGAWTQHWAFDSASSRYTPSDYYYYLNCNNPQLSVVPASADSLVRQLGESTLTPEPRWIIYNTGGLFKVGSNDTLWEYHAAGEYDSLFRFSVQSSIGEITTDDGLTLHYVDLADRDDKLTIDSAHPASYFLSSKDFSLPASGSVSYYARIVPSNDSLFKLHLDTVKYQLRFVDSASVVHPLDTLFICDSVPKLHGRIHTVTLALAHAMSVHLELKRLTQVLRTDTANWQDIIIQKRLSLDSSYKHGTGSSTEDGVTLTASPNPFRTRTAISFCIPASGAVSLQMFDVLGRSVAVLADQRQFHAGSHTLNWSNEHLASGTYLSVLHYGNTIRTLNVSIVR